jgi:arsenate reductase
LKPYWRHEIKLYGLKGCDSCKKALRDLASAGFDVTFVDVRATPVDAADVTRWLAAVGQEVLVNRKSTTWRGLSPDERELPALSLLVAHPTLIKRPVIEHDGMVHVGWTAPVKAALDCG